METSEIALQVKEQLLRHNIGQRVFGHYVLGLSQGSVSEILARPKPWSKLTVKGKEPFLKMKHFLSSEQNILALRNIQVRQRGNITPRIRTPEMGSDDAIRNILEQAKKEIQREGEEVSPLKTSGSGPSGRLSAGRASSSGAGDSDDTIKAILEQARREMVAQQRHQALREMAVCHWGTTTTTTAAASSSSPPASAEPRPPSVKQEGASSSVTASSPQLLQQTPLSVISPKDFVQNIIRKVKSEIGDAGSYQGGHWSAASSTSHPLTSVSPSLCSTTSSSSPFSNMAGQSSAWLDPWSRQPFSREQQDQEDALSSQGEDGHMVKVKVEAEEIEQDEGGEHLSPCSAYVTRPPKPIVPPLTPDQYDSFMHQQVDTVLLTRQVKDRLAQKGICQRIFGEKVLGLSQGSVSDILSRPKPWSKLTQKGREPFIRMQLWMQGQLGQKLSPSPPNNPSLEQEPVLASSSPSPDEERAGPLSEPGSLSLESSKENQQPPQQQGGPLGLGSLEMAPHHPTLSALDVQQLAILSPELDTLSITRRVKEVLNSNNLGQRLFGEMILGLTQGSVSDLLARPKPWSKLSLKGREPFVRMQLWLKDPQNIEKLREMKKMDNRAYLKRHHHLLSSGLDRDSPASASDMAPYLESSHPGQAKKARVVLATQEKETLKRAYQLEPYPSQSTIERLASQLGLKISTVINWFHNYRSRMRRDFEGGELLKADTLKPLPGDLQEMRQMHCSQSPSKGDRSLSMPVGLVTVKQEPWELRQAEEESSEADAHPTKYISMGVQFAGRLEMKEESLSSPSPRLCSRVKQEVRGECGETSASLPKPDRLPGTRPVPHASEAQTFSHSSKEDTEPKANAAASASASSSPTHTLPPVSPLPSSTTPTPLTSEAAAEQITVQQSLVAGHSTQQRSAKKANLDNIIHRLERAANREEMLEWEF
ncbi:homeobox protein cut-like 2 [Sardina pilchardus]|uniref:homeobox protein cut-like 2 n=1 Tax=Sardina pilchardus TaxID=27697 RepID=UPI002E110F07